MDKDFDTWNGQKQRIHAHGERRLFKEREVWWCSLGVNIGYERDGSGVLFTRPVVILTKFNLDTFLAVPLTARQKTGKYYLPIGTVDDREAAAVLSQIRYLDQKRLQLKITTLDQETFSRLKTAVRDACFPS